MLFRSLTVQVDKTVEIHCLIESVLEIAFGTFTHGSHAPKRGFGLSLYLPDQVSLPWGLGAVESPIARRLPMGIFDSAWCIGAGRGARGCGFGPLGPWNGARCPDDGPWAWVNSELGLHHLHRLQIVLNLFPMEFAFSCLASPLNPQR